MYDGAHLLQHPAQASSILIRRLPEADVFSQLFLGGLRLGRSSGYSRLTSAASHCVSPARPSRVELTASAVNPGMVVVACWGGQIGGKTAAERLLWLPRQPRQGRDSPGTSCSSLQSSPCRPVKKPPTGSSFAQQYVTLLHPYHVTGRRPRNKHLISSRQESLRQIAIGCMQRCRC